MKLIQGTVVVLETGVGVAGVTVVAFARADQQASARIGSVATDQTGAFRLEADGSKFVWDLTLEVRAATPKDVVLYADEAVRAGAGDVETWTIRIPTATLTAAGLLRPVASIARDLPALGSVVARSVADANFEKEVRDTLSAHLDPKRSTATQLKARLRTELVAKSRGGAPVAGTTPVMARQVGLLGAGLIHPRFTRPRRAFAVVTEAERAAIAAATAPAPARTLPAAVIEPLLFGEVRDGARMAVDLLTAACRQPRSLDEACAPPPAPPPAPTPVQTADELAAAVWAELHPASVEQGQRPDAADVAARIDGLTLSTGPADAPALHDFSVLQVPFDDVWIDLVDDDLVDVASQLFNEVERLGGKPAATTGPFIDFLPAEAAFMARQAPLLFQPPRSAFRPSAPDAATGVPDPMGTDGTRWVSALLAELEQKLDEPYRFTVYGADDTGTAINFGIVTTYRQRWQPLGYQAGRLVETITLAPREERTYTRKVTTSVKRRLETKEKAKSVTRTEEQTTQRAVKDIVETAERRTGLEASGSYGAVSGSLSVDDAKTSSDTRQNYREAVVKAASEYESDRSVDVSFESSTDVVVENTGKITNPNDELAVTFLFYQLQRRYHVSEHLHRVTPVVLVAQPVPKPNQIGIAWLLQHDWILRRVLLDPSFVPALDVVNTSLVGEEATVGQLRINLDKQRSVVEVLRVTLIDTQSEVAALFRGLQDQILGAADAQDGEGIGHAIANWIGGGGSEEGNRARVETAREALDRAQARERALAEQLQRELSTLTTMTNQWAAASRALLDKTVDVQRLRLHIKQNILYYMQAIWDHEPADQRLLRLHQLPVPVVTGALNYRVVDDPSAPPLPPHWTPPVVVEATLVGQTTGATVALGQIADLDRPLGYRGNYAVFPLREAHPVARYLMLPYVDRHTGAHDPDHLANLTRAELERYACCVRASMTPTAYEAIRPGLEEAHRRVLTDPRPLEEEIVVPTDALFIEALPADRPLLEDFKLRHRAADAAKAEAEAARVRLDNLRRGARILAGDLSDPDIDKKTVIEGVPASAIVCAESV
ncbi:MAG: hypothetical protein R3B06_26435 [Kofleriaceae bacterium]